MAALLIGAGAASAQMQLISQERRVELKVNADQTLHFADATDFGLFEGFVSHNVLVDNPQDPVNQENGGDVAISCHFEGGIDVTATMSGWGLSHPALGNLSAQAEVKVSLIFEVSWTQLMTLELLGQQSGGATADLYEMDLRLQDADGQGWGDPILDVVHESATTGHFTEMYLEPGIYRFRYSANMESFGSRAERQQVLGVRFEDFGMICPGDFNRDGGQDGADVEAFFIAYEAGSIRADMDQSGGVDGQDIEAFFYAWEGCC